MENSFSTKVFGTSRSKASATANPGSAPNGTLKAFSGTLSNTLIVPGSVTFTVTVSAAAVTITDNGQGVLSGTNVAGTLNYQTGAWTLVTVAALDNSSSILAVYRYFFLTPTQVTAGSTTITGAALTTKYIGKTAYGNIIPGTVTLSILFSTSAHLITDDGLGNLTSANTTYGFIDYNTGDIVIQFSTAPDAAAAMTATYKKDLENSTAILLTSNDYDNNGVKSLKITSTATTQAGYLILSTHDNGKTLVMRVQNSLAPGAVNVDRLSGDHKTLLMLAEKGQFNIQVS